jgi:hypothetical protein
MVANVFRLFGFWQIGKRAGGSAVRSSPGSPAAYAEALLAGWVPPLSEILVHTDAAEAATEEQSDNADFLARVYLHQQC